MDGCRWQRTGKEFRTDMEDQQSFSAGPRGSFVLLVVVLYVIGLAIWSPLFLVWPRRYAGLTFRQTVATRFMLVRLIWTGLLPTRLLRRGRRLPVHRRQLARRRR